MGAFFKYTGLIAISAVFLIFGVHILVAAYRLNNPHAFVMTFFASNFIILISGALIVGLILRLRHRRLAGRKILNPPEKQ